MRPRRKVTFHLTSWAVNTLALPNQREMHRYPIYQRGIYLGRLGTEVVASVPTCLLPYGDYPEKGDLLLDPLPGRR